LQEYFAAELYVVEYGSSNVPFEMFGAVPQSTRVQLGGAPLQIPSAWQVRVDDPVIE
jgi:hypothetical protein